MDYTAIIVELEDGLGRVTINRPKAMNALNNTVLKELNYLFTQEWAGKTDIKGVVITGAGDKAFVAGADISEFLELEEGSGRRFLKLGNDTFNAIENFHKPVIAAVNGYALGGGCELAMACHMRLANENAMFGQPEVNLGIIPGYGGTQRLTRLVGLGKSMELTLTGNMIGAEEAKTLGLVNHVVPSEELLSTCEGIILKTAKKAPLAITKSIEAINAYFAEDKSGYDVEADNFSFLADSKDFKEGASAFIEKRKPNFTGE